MSFTKMMMAMVFIALGIVCFLQFGFQVNKEVKIENISRVLMHMTDHYTFLFDIPNSKELGQVSFTRCRKIKLLKDVPLEKKSWAIAHFKGSWINAQDPYYLEIHIHNAGEIQGAGWNYGRLGSGQTIVIE